jgi:nitroreductase
MFLEEDTKMDAMEVLLTRRSIRSYSEKPVPRGQLEKIVNAARLAATARNEQPWDFIVVTDRSVLAKLAEIATYGKFIAQAGACIVVFCEETDHYCEDGSAATENLLLAATALGLGSCWVAGYRKPYAREIGDLLGVPKSHRLVSLVSVGTAQGDPPNPSKRPLEEVLHWEEF